MAISNRTPSVDVEYDCRGKRVRKHFENAHAGRAFYGLKLKAGKNPKVCKPEETRFEILECYYIGFEDPQPGWPRYIEKIHVAWFDTIEGVRRFYELSDPNMEGDWMQYETVEPAWYTRERELQKEEDLRLNDVPF